MFPDQPSILNYQMTFRQGKAGESEKIIGEAITGYRSQLVLSTKGGGKVNDFTQGFSRADRGVV